MNGAELKYKMEVHAKRAIWSMKKLGYAVASKAKEGAQWVMEHPTEAATLAGFGAAITGGANKVIRSIHKNVTVRHETKEKRTRIYDHSMNAYLYTKRPLKAEEVEKINKIRRETGKRTSEVLADLKLLKK